MDPLARLLRGALAVLTMWCVGCSSFEPMLESWLTDETSALATYMGEESGSASAPTDASIVLNSASPPAAQVGCGCTDCIAEEPAVPGLANAAHATPEAPFPTPAAFSGIGREPQVPPPRA
jgi:hypothetical protein